MVPRKNAMNVRWTIFALTVCVVHGGAYTIPVSAAREPHTRNANRLAVPRALLPAKSEVPSVNLKGATKFKIFRGDFVHCRDFEELEVRSTNRYARIITLGTLVLLRCA